MTTPTRTSLTRRARGLHPRKAAVQQLPGVKRSTLPEYLEAQEVQAVLSAAPNPRARLLMLLQWRAGVRVSEALALVAADLSLDSDQPTIRVREGKGGLPPGRRVPLDVLQEGLHIHVLSIRGESFRLREKPQAGLFLSQQHLAA